MQTEKYKTTGSVITVDYFSQHLVTQLEMLDVWPKTTAVTITDSDWFHLQRIGSRRPVENILPLELAKNFPRLMHESKAVVWDNHGKKLLYVFDVRTEQDLAVLQPLQYRKEASCGFDVKTGGKIGKVIVALNYRVKNSISNSIRSASLVNIEDIQEGKRYRVLEGRL
ncbi:MAG: hypothetical protein FWD70_00780 [Desulfuromonadales bacterium]|nr:hypothetical protein [Desulfuromonadales bacterium]